MAARQQRVREGRNTCTGYEKRVEERLELLAGRVMEICEALRWRRGTKNRIKKSTYETRGGEIAG